MRIFCWQGFQEFSAPLRVIPKDKRHLQGYAEAISAILQSRSACLGKWLSYLGHRGCQARAHMERLSYLVHNQHISPERFYNPLLKQALQAFEGSAVTLTLDTSMLWLGGGVFGVGRMLLYAGPNRSQTRQRDGRF